MLVCVFCAAQALERSERVRHVYVHAGGKIEALGTGMWAAPRGTVPSADNQNAGSMMTVETVCALDVRDQKAMTRTSVLDEFGMSAPKSPVRSGSEPPQAGSTAPAQSGGGGSGGHGSTKSSRKPADTSKMTEEQRQKEVERQLRRDKVCISQALRWQHIVSQSGCTSVVGNTAAALWSGAGCMYFIITCTSLLKARDWTNVSDENMWLCDAFGVNGRNEIKPDRNKCKWRQVGQAEQVDWM